MVCIYCGSKTEIINSRHQSRTNSTWRRRKCLECGAITTTTEQTDYEKSWVVSDDKGRISHFNRDRLFISLYNSLGHRRTAISDSNSLTATVIAKLAKKPSEGHINRQDIVDTSLTCLKHFDKAAAVHYKAYYAKSN
ncbi:MAG: hypothetical protein WDN66_01225 [Candidatus Saccharibacteria bacterium]